MFKNDFLNNKWFKCYVSITEKAKNRVLADDVYKENHHIVPKSLGGSNNKVNIVALTGREHLIVHKLLIRFLLGEDRKKMLGGLWAMVSMKQVYSNKRIKVSSREFEQIRKAFFLSRRGLHHSLETKEKLRQAFLGKKVDKEVIERRSKTLKDNIASGKTVIVGSKEGAKKRKETIKNWSEERKQEYKNAVKVGSAKSIEIRKNWSEDKKQEFANKMRAANSGKKRSEKQKENIRNGILKSSYIPSQETRYKIGAARKGKKSGPVMLYTFKNPDGEIIIREGKAKDIFAELNLSIKYLFLSLKADKPVKCGNSAGWQLLSKEKIRKMKF